MRRKRKRKAREKSVTPEWLEHPAFWSGVRRATIAPRSPVEGEIAPREQFNRLRRRLRINVRCERISRGIARAPGEEDPHGFERHQLRNALHLGKCFLSSETEGWYAPLADITSLHSEPRTCQGVFGTGHESCFFMVTFKSWHLGHGNPMFGRYTVVVSYLGSRSNSSAQSVPWGRLLLVPCKSPETGWFSPGHEDPRLPRQ